jgi:hypothetical protein
VTASHSKKGLSAIAITFSDSLDAGSARNPGLYRLFAGVKKRGKTAYTKALGIGSVAYSDSTHTVTINLAKPFKGSVQVTVEPGLTAAGGSATSSSFMTIVK